MDNLQYCLYARKSSESDERQAMSIDSQIKEMQALAQRDGINIKEIRYESHSAKQSGQRPVFKSLIADIMLGEFSGILTWHPDRLSRNAGDLGALVDLMDQGKLQEIKTYTQTFKNQPNDKFLLMILCSQAKLENDNKGINVKRGMKAKCEMGWRPGVAPLGYMNRAFGGVKDIIVDPERAPIIKEAFERVAYMYHSGRMIKEWMDRQQFTTRKGKRITTSMVYLFLRNPFYCGFFEYPKGKLYRGKHEALISKELFDDVQKEITIPRKVRWGQKGFAFKGLFTCYLCGSSVVGEEKLRPLSNGRKRRHVYYHCTRFKDKNCSEPYIEEKNLLKQIMDLVDLMDVEAISLPGKLKGAMMEYKKLVEDTLRYNTQEVGDHEIDTKDYIRYILREGTSKAKHDLMELLPIPRYFHERTLASKRS